MTRRWALSPFTFARRHLQSKNALSEENCTTKVTFHDMTVNTIAVVVVDDQPVLTDHLKTDEKRCRLD